MFDRVLLATIGRETLRTEGYRTWPDYYIDMYRGVCTLIAPVLSFTDRTSYLQWKSNWIFEYRMLTLEIRVAKKAVREKGSLSYPQRRIEQDTLRHLYQCARGMLEIRKLSKYEANRQRNALVR